MPKKNRMNSVNTKSDGSCSGILVVIVILIIIVIIVGMMSRKKRYTCEYYKDQQLTTDQQCPTDKPCKSNTTNNCMKKLNDVCPGCTTDQSPISDKKVVGQWLETGKPVGTSYNMISAGLMDGSKGFYQPPGTINFPLTTKYRFITYGGAGVGNNKFPSMDYLFFSTNSPWNCIDSEKKYGKSPSKKFVEIKGDLGSLDLECYQMFCGGGLDRGTQCPPNPNSKPCDRDCCYWPGKCTKKWLTPFNGIDFDMEGKAGEGLPYATFTDTITDPDNPKTYTPTTEDPFVAIVAFTKAVRFYAKQNNYPVPYFQLTVNGNIHDRKIKDGPETPSYDVSDIAKVQDNFDFIALMLYGGKESRCGGGGGKFTPYADWCVPDNMQPSWVDSKNKTTCVTKEENNTEGCGTSRYIHDWLESDVDKTKIILGMADDSTSNQVKIFSQIVENHNLAGISFWKQQDADVIDTAGNLLL